MTVHGPPLCQARSIFPVPFLAPFVHRTLSDGQWDKVSAAIYEKPPFSAPEHPGQRSLPTPLGIPETRHRGPKLPGNSHEQAIHRRI